MPDILPRILLGAPAGFRPNQHNYVVLVQTRRSKFSRAIKFPYCRSFMSRPNLDGKASLDFVQFSSVQAGLRGLPRSRSPAGRAQGSLRSLSVPLLDCGAKPRLRIFFGFWGAVFQTPMANNGVEFFAPSFFPSLSLPPTLFSSFFPPLPFFSIDYIHFKMKFKDIVFGMV